MTLIVEIRLILQDGKFVNFYSWAEIVYPILFAEYIAVCGNVQHIAEGLRGAGNIDKERRQVAQIFQIWARTCWRQGATRSTTDVNWRYPCQGNKKVSARKWLIDNYGPCWWCWYFSKGLVNTILKENVGFRRVMSRLVPKLLNFFQRDLRRVDFWLTSHISAWFSFVRLLAVPQNQKAAWRKSFWVDSTWVDACSRDYTWKRLSCMQRGLEKPLAQVCSAWMQLLWRNLVCSIT